MKEFAKTDRTTITRLPKRGVYDKDAVYSILDEALFCTLAFVREGTPFQIPTGFCRIEDTLYVHGSVGSFYMRELAKEKAPVCVSATLMDGIVLARSAFHHSVNYRSAVVFGKAVVVQDKETLYKVLEVFTEKMCAGRWNDVRKPTDNEWKATMVLAIRIDEASAKVRTGPPKDDEEDYTLDIWAGVQTLQTRRGALVQDPDLKKGVPIPNYLKAAETPDTQQMY